MHITITLGRQRVPFPGLHHKQSNEIWWN